MNLFYTAKVIDPGCSSLIDDPTLPFGTAARINIIEEEMTDPNVGERSLSITGTKPSTSAGRIFPTYGTNRLRLRIIIRRSFIWDFTFTGLIFCKNLPNYRYRSWKVLREIRTITRSRNGGRIKVVRTTRRSLESTLRPTLNRHLNIWKIMKTENLTKYIFVTGGVISGSQRNCQRFDRLLAESPRYRVTIQKFDPYINIDPER
jgi:hypothetical protein